MLPFDLACRDLMRYSADQVLDGRLRKLEPDWLLWPAQEDPQRSTIGIADSRGKHVSYDRRVEGDRSNRAPRAPVVVVVVVVEASHACRYPSQVGVHTKASANCALLDMLRLMYMRTHNAKPGLDATRCHARPRPKLSVVSSSGGPWSFVK